jgi:hypothetical protein
MGKDGGGDVGVMIDVLRRADQVGFVETADFNERVIAVRDDTSCIRCRDEFLLRSKGNLARVTGWLFLICIAPMP